MRSYEISMREISKSQRVRKTAKTTKLISFLNDYECTFAVLSIHVLHSTARLSTTSGIGTKMDWSGVTSM